MNTSVIWTSERRFYSGCNGDTTERIWMFKNRKITVTVDKKDKDTDEGPVDPRSFEQKAEVILNKLERFGKMAFLGLCTYVILDTYRQVRVADANQPNE